MPLLKYNNNSISNVTSFPLVPSGSLKLLATATASASASLSFNSTYINGDYQIYKFEFINIHPATDDVEFTFNMSTDNGSNYNVTKTSTNFATYHDEADTTSALSYQASSDLAQSTAFQRIAGANGNGADENCSGTLQLFNPASTVYVKHFISNFQKNTYHNYSFSDYVAGYGSTTTAINAIQFKFSSGNIADGQIKLYGLGAN
jgi:hypothetical protein